MSDPQEIAEFLAKVPLFNSLKKGQLARLAKVMVTEEYEAGQGIVVQGQSGVGLFIVVSGRAEAIHTRADGTRTVVNIFCSTDYFGELALLAEGPRTASVVAVEPTKCLVLTRWNFLGVLRRDADMAVAVLEELAWRFRIALETL
ncbi:MAG: cyclic nucleotide-binding domain-containing protein [Anaerolineae bacterium]|nr:cyclic nucleotide-binding domain-containing protein [Anaerolineae bacterium]